MTTAHWVQGARLRTLPAAIVPVAIGTGVAIDAGSAVWWRAGLALLVALALQVGVNYANDYSDGIRGSDTDRVGPTRLVASKLAKPRTVLTAAWVCFAVAVVAGLVLVMATGSWWLLGLGACSIAAAWFYTGGNRPYGYRAFGEVSVFVFFGLVAVLGTAYVQLGHFTWTALAAGIAAGLQICALLVVNNLRDIPGDARSGKRTLAVVLGDRPTRWLFASCALAPFLVVIAVGTIDSPALVGLVALVAAVSPVRTVLSGETGQGLIPALRDTGRLLLAFGAMFTLGLAL